MRLLWTLVSVIACACFLACGSGPSTKYGDANDLRTEIDASRHAKDTVSKFLKYPKDADFSFTRPASKNSAGVWICPGSVKAMNAFGAKITHDYQVSMIYDEESWSIIAVLIDGELQALDNEAAERALSLSKKNEVAPMDRGGSQVLSATASSDEPPSNRPFLDPKLVPAELREPDAAAAEPDLRTWTSSSGNFTVEAEFVSHKEAMVTLRKADGTELTLDSQKLAAEDRTWIRKHLERERRKVGGGK